MVRVITQETFDAAVKENMEDLEMERKEAVEDAKKQFESQGVDLTNIVISDGPEIGQVVRDLQATFDSDGRCTDLAEAGRLCDTLAAECAKGLAQRVLATERAAYPAIVRVLQVEMSSGEGGAAAHVSAMRALTALADTNPDVLEGEGCKAIYAGLQSADAALVEASLEATLNCSVRHEHNRQNFVSNNLLDLLDKVVQSHTVRVARIWQALVQDDDVRVPFGKAHDHAREIVEDHEALRKLCDAITAG